MTDTTTDAALALLNRITELELRLEDLSAIVHALIERTTS